MSKQPIDSKIDIAKRLIQLRELTGLSRRGFARKYGFSEHTLKSWEHALQTGLSRKGAELVINAYQNEGIECTVEWLLLGKGKTPKRQKDEVARIKIKEAPSNAYQTIEQEVAAFKVFHPEAVVMEIRDDSALPFYHIGDTVGGVRHYGRDLAQLIGKDCIVETVKGELLLRVVIASTIPQRFNLYAMNPRTRLGAPYQYDQDIVSAAPVIWIRRGKKW